MLGPMTRLDKDKDKVDLVKEKRHDKRVRSCDLKYDALWDHLPLSYVGYAPPIMLGLMTCLDIRLEQEISAVIPILALS